ncbi:MAG: hypothetical protein WC516_05725 [Patescibacteria group bacterium]|jgi:hypothetical protein
MIYNYTKLNSPDLDKLHLLISQSEMINKDILFCEWNGQINELQTIWATELFDEDLNKLNLIIDEI